MKRILMILLAVFVLKVQVVRADGHDEGMWLPFLINLNIADMQAKGCQLTAQQIYDINNACLKDAIATLDHGSCTAELISPEGLLLTNHHCGYDELQQHSSVGKNYVDDGFWAMQKSDELPNDGKSVSFLVRVEDVTAKFTSRLNAQMSESDRERVIKDLSAQLEAEAIDGTHYEASVEQMFHGNYFYIFVYETFLDVRLVGAPPSSIGKFGGDTDNWMWPRHTGDFLLFRVYTAPDGKPAPYSPNNIPLKSKSFLPISLKGVKKDDFAMIMGYPGTTTRYLTSWGVQETMDLTNDIRVKVRTEKLGIMKKDMDASEAIFIKYAAKYASSSNYWKYSIGQNKGLQALDVVNQKRNTEKQFTDWVNADPQRKKDYGEALGLIETGYKERYQQQKALEYWFEALYQGPEVIEFALQVRQLENAVAQQGDVDALKKQIKEDAVKHFKDYNWDTDRKVALALLQMYANEVPQSFQPSVFEDVVKKKFKGSFQKYVDDMYKKSVFVDEKRFNAFIDNFDAKQLANDAAYQLMNASLEVYWGINQGITMPNAKLDKGMRLLAAGMAKMNANKNYYPDANSTMRLTYGKVGDYEARDAVIYKHYTTLDGIIEKEDATNPEFIVPAKLKDLYLKKDYGRYAAADGSMPVCFTTNNDITGGNSGSPVINGKGELIGIAFDGNWEAMSGDIAFEPKLQKTICVDIRYVLLVIDKFAGASNLISEMKFVE